MIFITESNYSIINEDTGPGADTGLTVNKTVTDHTGIAWLYRFIVHLLQ